MSGLFVQVWQTTDEKLSFGLQERLGIEYLAALGPLAVALTKAESARVGGSGADVAPLASAVEHVATVDARLGGPLGVTQRWADARAKIDSLSGTAMDPEAAYTSYAEMTDLLLALYEKVRQNSGLIRDPDADAFYLQDAAARALPQSIVAAGRYADVAVLAAKRPAASQAQTLADLIGARGDVANPATAVADDVAAAAAVPAAQALSNDVLAQLDRFRFTTDAIGDDGTVVAGPVNAAGAAALSALTNNAIPAAATLLDTVLAAADTVIAARLDRLRLQRDFAVVVFGLALLIAVVPLLLVVVGMSRSRRRGQPSGRHGQSADEPDAAGSGPQYPAWAVPGAPQQPTRREREHSGAPR